MLCSPPVTGGLLEGMYQSCDTLFCFVFYLAALAWYLIFLNLLEFVARGLHCMRQARKHGGAASLGKPLECVWGYLRLYLFLIVLCPVIPQCSVYKCPVHTSPEVFSSSLYYFHFCS